MQPPLDIQASVIKSHDHDIKPGTRVTIVGYTAVVPEVKRRNTMGGSQTLTDITVGFSLDELRLDRRIDRTAVDKLPGTTVLLPEVWATILGFDVMDWDGWNDMGRDLSHPCTRQDFDHRINKCTVKNLSAMVDRGMERADPNPIRRTSTTKTPCCGYAIAANDVGPIFWNEFNDVVQCHNCGQVFGNPHWPDKQGEAEPSAHAEPPNREHRKRLPDTRNAVTHKFDIAGQKGYITVGFYGTGDDVDTTRPGEVFVVVQKQGSTLQGFADAWARSVSMLLQYGVPVSEIARMFAWHKFEPRGYTNNPDIVIAHSIVDYVARWLGHLCIEDYQPGGEPIAEVPDKTLDATAPTDAR